MVCSRVNHQLAEVVVMVMVVVVVVLVVEVVIVVEVVVVVVVATLIVKFWCFADRASQYNLSN